MGLSAIDNELNFSSDSLPMAKYIKIQGALIRDHIVSEMGKSPSELSPAELTKKTVEWTDKYKKECFKLFKRAPSNADVFDWIKGNLYAKDDKNDEPDHGV